MGRARLILREKIIDEEGNLTEFVIWQIPGRHQEAERVRYRLAFIRRGEQTPAVLYDNHDPKGHHRHLEGVESRTSSSTWIASWPTSLRTCDG